MKLLVFFSVTIFLVSCEAIYTKPSLKMLGCSPVAIKDNPVIKHRAMDILVNMILTKEQYAIVLAESKARENSAKKSSEDLEIINFGARGAIREEKDIRPSSASLNHRRSSLQESAQGEVSEVHKYISRELFLSFIERYNVEIGHLREVVSSFDPETEDLMIFSIDIKHSYYEVPADRFYERIHIHHPHYCKMYPISKRYVARKIEKIHVEDKSYNLGVEILMSMLKPVSFLWSAFGIDFGNKHVKITKYTKDSGVCRIFNNMDRVEIEISPTEEENKYCYKEVNNVNFVLVVKKSAPRIVELETEMSIDYEEILKEQSTIKIDLREESPSSD